MWGWCWARISLSVCLSSLVRFGFNNAWSVSFCLPIAFNLSSITILLNAAASAVKFSLYSLIYANFFAPRIRVFGWYPYDVDLWENLCSIYITIINNLELFKKFFQSNTNKLLTGRRFRPLHIFCLFSRSLTMIALLLVFVDANDAVVPRANNGKFLYQYTSDPTIIEYLKAIRLCFYPQIERNRQKMLHRI